MLRVWRCKLNKITVFEKFEVDLVYLTPNEVLTRGEKSAGLSIM